MKKILIVGLMICLILTNYNSLKAQKMIKWGKVSKYETGMTECFFEKDASAVVLQSKGLLYFDDGKVNIDKHVRIKILDNNGLDNANQNFIYYYKDDFELISKLKAQTININEKGKKEIIKVEKNQIFDKELSSELKEKSFTFPAVKVGSIIEYKYTTTLDSYVFLNAWDFQSEIPTLYSYFKAEIPVEFQLDYNILYIGKRLIKKYTGKSTNEWSLDNIAGLKQEDYVYSWRDNSEYVQFQLEGYMKKSATYAMDGDWVYEKFIGSWTELVDKILSLPTYESYLTITKRPLLTKINDDILKDAKSTSEKINCIYNYVSKNYIWNGKYSQFPDQNISKLIKEKTGSGVEINLLLVALLKNADIDASPVLISTKNHGAVFKEYPMIYFFNHALCSVNIRGNYFLFDATDPFRSKNMLSIQDLNKWGLVLNRKKHKWVKIPATENTYRKTDCKIYFTEKEKTIYECEFEYSGYQALEKRKLYYENKELFFENHLDILPTNLQLDSFAIENFDNYEFPLVVKAYYHADENPFDANTTYINPYHVKHFETHPFKAKRRNAPIDFAYKTSDEITLRIYYPKNYKIESIPENELIYITDKTGKYSFKTLDVGDYVKIESKLIMNGTYYFVEEYEQLQKFFSEVIKKPNEILIFKN